MSYFLTKARGTGDDWLMGGTVVAGGHTLLLLHDGAVEFLL
jgi:hypothetical protein